MNKQSPWVTGVALALALAVLYTVCAGAFALWPQATLEFFNAWFHGLNLTGMQSGAMLFTIGLFIYGLVGLSASAFVRVRAGFTGQDTHDILTFLQAGN